MNEHKRVANKREGRNEGGSITPVCSCGWEGTKHYAYNDYQHTNAQEQFDAHAKASGQEG